MSGIKFLYITGEGEVYPIPTPKDSVYKVVPKLANESVLEVNLFYETKNRRSWRLIHVGFDRIQLDKYGQYTMTDEETSKSFFNFIHFGFATVKELTEREEPLAIPKAPVIPNVKEKVALISFIKRKCPFLWENSPQVVEQSIKSRQNQHSELISMVKKASLNKRKNEATKGK